MSNLPVRRSAKTPQDPEFRPRNNVTSLLLHAYHFNQDVDGTHTVEVTAESLYEAVAQGLAALRRSDWVAGFQQSVVKVLVADVRVEHQVKLTDFTKWLERTNASSPREMVQRQRLRAILGMSAR